MNCDFCYAPDPKYWNKVSEQLAMVLRKGALARLAVTFNEDWAACPTCQELINKGDREGLTRRCFKAESIKPGDPVAAVMTDLHKLFMQYRLNIPPIEKGKENRG